MPKVEWKTRKITIVIPTGCDFQKAASRSAEIPLKFGCRRGECGVCKMKIIEGMENLTKRTPEEIQTLARRKLTDDYRLACQCSLNGCGDIVIGED